MQSLAPIILFTYRRIPEDTINTLLDNNLAETSEIHIYSDGYKNEIDKPDVLGVRAYLKTIEGFKNITIIEAEKNKGLANSIISGVTDIINSYGKVIVVEDDLLVATNFLEYMNCALQFYKNDNKIWSISGYGPNLACFNNYNKDLYLSPRGSSWGWATWSDRWASIDWYVKCFNKIKYNKQLRKDFEVGGNDMYKMLELQMLGKIDSWAIRWCFSQFLQNKYTVYPVKSKIINNGFNDNKGTHNSGNSIKWDVEASDKKVKFKKLEIDTKIVEYWKKYHNISLYTKIGYLLKKHGGYRLMKILIKGVKNVRKY